MSSLLSPKFTVICTLFQPRHEDSSGTFWLPSAPRTEGTEVNFSQKRRGRPSKTTDTSWSRGHFQEFRGLFSYLCVYCGDEPQVSTVGDLPALEQSHLVTPAVCWKLYSVCSEVLFQPTFSKMFLLCLKPSLQFLTDHFTGYFLKSKLYNDFIIKKNNKKENVCDIKKKKPNYKPHS